MIEYSNLASKIFTATTASTEVAPNSTYKMNYAFVDRAFASQTLGPNTGNNFVFEWIDDPIDSSPAEENNQWDE